MAFNPKYHLFDNLEALRLAFDLQRESRMPTAPEADVLRRYVGFGGYKAVLNPPEEDAFWQSQPNHELRPLGMDLHEFLSEQVKLQGSEECHSSLNRCVLMVFYTPPQLVNALTSHLGAKATELLEMSPPISSISITEHRQSGKTTLARMLRPIYRDVSL